MTIALATCSYHWIELPVRTRVWPVGRRAWQSALIATAVVATALLLLPWQSGDAAIALEEADSAPAMVPGGLARKPRILLVEDSVAASLAVGFRAWAEHRRDIELLGPGRSSS